MNAAGWTELCEQTPATVSVGVAFGPFGDFDALTASADAALYRAKQAGGDRSVAGP
jgi:PleD family two-component response regulator